MSVKAVMQNNAVVAAVAPLTRLLADLLCVAGIVMPLPGQTCAPPPSSLIAWWPGDGNAKDVLGKNPAIGATAGVRFAPGLVGQAFEFSGGWMSMGTGAAVTGKGAFTVDAWVKTTTPSGVLINQRGTGPDDFLGEYVLSIGGGMIGTPEEPFAAGPGLVCWSTFGDEGWGFNFCSNAAVNDDRWHHIAAVREADGTGAIYLDGVLDKAVGGTPQNLIKVDVFLGANVRDASFGDPYAFYYDGLIDEIDIFGRTLSADEIRRIYSAGGKGKCKPPLPDSE